MSYSSRVYRQRNAHTHDEGKQDAFFGKQHDINKPKKSNSFFQAKLAINKPGDKYEKEADSVANAVVNKSSSKSMVQQKKISGIQRLSTPAEEEKMGTNDARMKNDKELQEKPIQRMTTDPEKEKQKGVQKKDDPEKEKKKTNAVQTKQDANTGTASPGVSSRIENTAGTGHSLPAKTLNEMGTAFGVDFSDVRIHNDGEAADMNKELQAQAFTHGKDIYFNEGKYDPHRSDGKNLLAHELTHVVQQSTTGDGKSKSGAIQPYRPKKGFNFGRKDTPDLAEESFNAKKDKKTKPWIEEISIVFTGVGFDGDGDMMPTGTMVATYKENDATKADPFMPLMMSFPITGGKHKEMYTTAGEFAVTRIEGVGYSNTSDDPGNPKEGPGKKYDVDLNSNMSFAIFFHRGEAIHRGALTVGSHGCVHVDWGGAADEGDTEKMRRLNYHSVIGLTKVKISYDEAILPELCCKRYEYKKRKSGAGSNPCNTIKVKSCP